MESRQYSVTVHFNKQTPEDYLQQAYLKVCKIHRNYPKGGGILVFLTGQQEVKSLCNKLKTTFPYLPKSKQNSDSDVNDKNHDNKEVYDNIESIDRNKKAKRPKKLKNLKTLDDIMPNINLDK